MSKAKQILELYELGHTTRVIAEIVYGLSDETTPASEWAKRMSYVRVVARQRMGGQSEFDLRYRRTATYLHYQREYQKRRYRSEPAFRAANMERTRQWRQRQKAERQVELA